RHGGATATVPGETPGSGTAGPLGSRQPFVLWRKQHVRSQGTVGQSGARRVRRRDRMGHDEPARETQRDEPGVERRDASDGHRARDRRPLQGARVDRRRRIVRGRHGSQGILPRDRRRAGHDRARRAPRRRGVAVAALEGLSEADDRDGQRLVLRRRVHAARRVRSRDRRRGGDLRVVGDQLGHPARGQRDEGRDRDDGPAQRALLRDDWRDLRRQEGGADGSRERGRAAGRAQGTHARARAGADREEPDDAAQREARREARPRHGLGHVRGLPLREGRRGAPLRRGRAPREGDEGVPRRQDLQTRPRAIQGHEVERAAARVVSPYDTLVRSGRCLLLDGGTGSELRRRGVRLDPIAWSGPAALACFDTLVDIHSDYIDAGADVITTSTFATPRFVLEAAGSVSCFPPGFDAAAYPPPAEERAAYAELANLLAAEGVDFLVLEMMEDDVHAARACEAAHATGLPFWIGVSARRRTDGTLTAYDFPETPLDRVIDALVRFTPDVMNVMHTPPDDVAPALAVVRTRWTGPIGAYPEIEEPGTRALTPAGLAARAEEWLRAGVRVLGGCCGTEPQHV